jgi:hypothetical protein
MKDEIWDNNTLLVKCETTPFSIVNFRVIICKRLIDIILVDLSVHEHAQAR